MDLTVYTYDGFRASNSWGHFHFWVNYPFNGSSVHEKKKSFLAFSWKCAELGSLLQQQQTVKVKVCESEFISLWDVM